MLQRVALGQIRFNLPGLAADARGVVAGKQLGVRFAAIDRLVSFFRLLSGEQSLDDLQPGLRILQVRASGGAREAIVLMPAGSTHLCDTVARAARTAGGQCFTGNGKHFVLYRDARAPLGYDAPATSQEAGDLIFYGLEHTVSYVTESELPLQKLLLRLSLQRQHGGPLVTERGPLTLTARRGLGPLVAEYLRRAQNSDKQVAATLHAWAALCEGGGESSFQPGSGFWLFRLEGLPERMIGLFSRTPGLALYAPLCENVVVAVGYRHPIHLDACKATFPADRFFLFAPAAGEGSAGVTVLAPVPQLAALEDLVRIRTPLTRDPGLAQAKPSPRPDLVVPLRLEPSAGDTRRAVATLIPWAQSGWLKRLCYALPGTALKGYRVVLLDRGVLVISPGVLDGFPFGTLLDTAAPDVLIPLGSRLRPAVSPGLLAERTGALGGALVVFPALGEPPFRIAPEAIEPLERRTLAEADVQTGGEAGAGPGVAEASVRGRSLVRTLPAPIEIENDRLGPMPLWGIGR
jgi:hypothetical protein